ncbi:MAG TPA: DUF4058 family protein [Pirellulales bacterium]
MPSPFPGMDPYLEQSGAWGDFHLEFISCLRSELRRQLPSNYNARIQERVTVIESFEVPPRSYEPDLMVARRKGAAEPAERRPGAALLEPVTVPLILPEEEERQHYIEIYDQPEQILVAVVELLSPTNKLSHGREQYLLKRDAVLRQDVHLIELDLLACGQRLPTAEPYPQDDYYAFVARADQRPLCDVYHWCVRQPLPPVPIPLYAGDADVIVELQSVFTEAFARGGYEERLHYGIAPRARLSQADRQWATELAATAWRGGE